MEKPLSPIDLAPADLELVTGGNGGLITNPLNPGFYTQWWGRGGSIRAPLSGDVKTGPQTYCMPGSICHFHVAPQGAPATAPRPVAPGGPTQLRLPGM